MCKCGKRNCCCKVVVNCDGNVRTSGVIVGDGSNSNPVRLDKKNHVSDQVLWDSLTNEWKIALGSNIALATIGTNGLYSSYASAFSSGIASFKVITNTTITNISPSSLPQFFFIGAGYSTGTLPTLTITNLNYSSSGPLIFLGYGRNSAVLDITVDSSVSYGFNTSAKIIFRDLDVIVRGTGNPSYLFQNSNVNINNCVFDIDPTNTGRVHLGEAFYNMTASSINTNVISNPNNLLMTLSNSSGLSNIIINSTSNVQINTNPNCNLTNITGSSFLDLILNGSFAQNISALGTVYISGSVPSSLSNTSLNGDLTINVGTDFSTVSNVSMPSNNVNILDANNVILENINANTITCLGASNRISHCQVTDININGGALIGRILNTVTDSRINGNLNVATGQTKLDKNFINTCNINMQGSEYAWITECIFIGAFTDSGNSDKVIFTNCGFEQGSTMTINSSYWIFNSCFLSVGSNVDGTNVVPVNEKPLVNSCFLGTASVSVNANSTGNSSL